MNEEFLKQLVAELIEAQQTSAGIIATAIAKQIDPQRFAEDLRNQIQAAVEKGCSELAEKIATTALGAVVAECRFGSQKATH